MRVRCPDDVGRAWLGLMRQVRLVSQAAVLEEGSEGGVRRGIVIDVEDRQDAVKAGEGNVGVLRWSTAGQETALKKRCSWCSSVTWSRRPFRRVSQRRARIFSGDGVNGWTCRKPGRK